MLIMNIFELEWTESFSSLKYIHYKLCNGNIWNALLVKYNYLSKLKHRINARIKHT
jgi:hypothetical protein